VTFGKKARSSPAAARPDNGELLASAESSRKTSTAVLIPLSGRPAHRTPPSSSRTARGRARRRHRATAARFRDPQISLPKDAPRADAASPAGRAAIQAVARAPRERRDHRRRTGPTTRATPSGGGSAGVVSFDAREHKTDPPFPASPHARLRRFDAGGGARSFVAAQPKPISRTSGSSRRNAQPADPGLSTRLPSPSALFPEGGLAVCYPGDKLAALATVLGEFGLMAESSRPAAPIATRSSRPTWGSPAWGGRQRHATLFGLRFDAPQSVPRRIRRAAPHRGLDVFLRADSSVARARRPAPTTRSRSPARHRRDRVPERATFATFAGISRDGPAPIVSPRRSRRPTRGRRRQVPHRRPRRPTTALHVEREGPA